ncbi:hypothetical protein EcHS_A2195 [Escherichia coli HS]|nr:hypothetical protein EcHS_A2195 [Escherichia coli HS]EFK17562.1 hypothetical protein HMPREF9541_00011 [Escherichia coli MS 116-1]EFK93000.1 hypothetical protein HMPREF9543_00090 [Escherichia coli MS 146-1]KDX57117.1 hypothetical protein AB87_1262 [Escherichia coli 2-210-07_S3_C1]
MLLHKDSLKRLKNRPGQDDHHQYIFINFLWISSEVGLERLLILPGH